MFLTCLFTELCPLLVRVPWSKIMLYSGTKEINIPNIGFEIERKITLYYKVISKEACIDGCRIRSTFYLHTVKSNPIIISILLKSINKFMICFHDQN